MEVYREVFEIIVILAAIVVGIWYFDSVLPFLLILLIRPVRELIFDKLEGLL